MWSFRAPAAIATLLAVALLPSASAKLYPSPTTPARLDDPVRLRQALAKRQCKNVCGYYNQVCCDGRAEGTQCFTDINSVAGCTSGLANGGGWIYSTVTYAEAATVTRTSVWSSFVGGAVPTGAGCKTGEQKCGSACCGGGYYCYAQDTSSCRAIGGGSGSPGVTVITATGSTIPFTTPIPTGANGTPEESNSGGGLSGGAIAGIVIGVLAGIALLLLICFYCCAKAAFDGVLAIIGLGKKKRHTHEETTYIEEHHSGAAGGRRWYGQAGSSRPSRPAKKDNGGFGKLLGLGAGAAALGALMGMRKKKNEHKYDDKSTTVTDSSYYYSDYTSSSSASSDDRRTRHTRQSSRR